MSFILDALRKSENERQQDARPNIARIPDAVPHRRLPAWAIGTMALLGVGVLVLGAAWWRSTQTVPMSAEAISLATVTPSAPGSRAQDPGRDSGAAAASQQGAATTTLQIPVPERAARADPSGSPTAVALPSSDARTALRGAAAGGARASQESARPAPSRLPAVDASLPNYDSSSGLPALRLELHAYSETPANRFVFINGTRYAEGETLTEGPRLIAITPEGAVLLAGSRQLLLGQQ